MLANAVIVAFLSMFCVLRSSVAFGNDDDAARDKLKFPPASSKGHRRRLFHDSHSWEVTAPSDLPLDGIDLLTITQLVDTSQQPLADAAAVSQPSTTFQTPFNDPPDIPLGVEPDEPVEVTEPSENSDSSCPQQENEQMRQLEKNVQKIARSRHRQDAKVATLSTLKDMSQICGVRILDLDLPPSGEHDRDRRDIYSLADVEQDINNDFNNNVEQEETTTPEPKHTISTVVLHPDYETGVSLHINTEQIQTDATQSPVGIGVIAKAVERPWHASLHYKDQHACSAALINKQLVLTAAQCFDNGRLPDDLEQWKLYLGKSNMSAGEKGEVGPLKIDQIVVHPCYDSVTKIGDIALVKFAGPVANWTNKVAAICLPPEDIQPIFSKSRCFSSGFYKMQGDIGRLRQYSLPIVENGKCRRNAEATPLDPSMMCTGSLEDANSCDIDFGGPLTCNAKSKIHVLEGIVSFGFNCNNQKRSTFAYTRVSTYINWIWKVIDRI